MPYFVKGEAGLNHSIIYTDNTERYFRYSGGTWAWRDHNPGNLVPGSVSARHNQIGSTGKFAIFPDYKNGHSALLDCLKTTYKNASINYLVSKFAPAKDGNNVKIYRKFLHDRTGVKDDKKVKDFTASEFDKLWHAIEAMEGYKEGIVTEVFPITEVYRDKNGICELHIKGKGWASKSECINLAKQGCLDLIVCISHMRHEYLRARPNSSVNGSLEHMIVKKPKEKGK
ncbi:MAG TPA: hypothetical protein VJB02_02705 [Coxiellaceae bacterium]|nr:hypothetical protein [Coxiellaceae bacterium]